MDSQDRWNKVSLGSMIHETRMLSMNLESEDKDGGEDASLVTQSNSNLLCDTQSGEGKWSGSFSTGYVEQKPEEMPGRTTDWGKKGTEDHPDSKLPSIRGGSRCPFQRLLTETAS